MPEDRSSESGWLRKLWWLWTRIVDLLLGRNYPQTPVWRRWWMVAFIASAFCSLLHIFAHRPWLEFIPGWAIGEVTLIALFMGVPFPVYLSVWRLFLFPTTCVWLPYFIRLVFGDAESHPFSKFFEDHFGLKFIPKMYPPDVGDPAYGALRMAKVCLGFTFAVLVTAVLLICWRAWGTHSDRGSFRGAPTPPS
jgi:hypothetical protein